MIAAVVAGPLFATYSKNPAVPFDNAARLERRGLLEPTLAGEVGEARRWLEHQGEDMDAIGASLRNRSLLA
jgi:hypothetical protein